MSDEMKIAYSPLCQTIVVDDRTAEVLIYRNIDGKWILEIEDDEGGSTVWDNSFENDEDALEEGVSTIEKIGIKGLINEQG